MDQVDAVWVHHPDPVGRQRARTRVRFGTLAITVALVVLGWSLGGVAGGMVALAVLVVTVLAVESWARSTHDDAAQWVWVDGGVLCVDGPEVYRYDGEGFEHLAPPSDVAVGGVGPSEQITEVDAIEWASVYPSTTDDDGRRQFHLVLDVTSVVEPSGDRRRRCVVFDRRIPFRIGGETHLATAIGGLVGHRWVDPHAIEVTFGELDERRLADWSSAMPGSRRRD